MNPALVGIAALLLGVATGPAPLGAHAVLVKSAPTARATVARTPARVALTFNERLEPAYSTVSVWSEAGARVDRNDATVDTSDGKVLSVSLPPLPPGRYTARFRVLSVDGHIVESSFQFSVRP